MNKAEAKAVKCGKNKSGVPRNPIGHLSVNVRVSRGMSWMSLILILCYTRLIKVKNSYVSCSWDLNLFGMREKIVVNCICTWILKVTDIILLSKSTLSINIPSNKIDPEHTIPTQNEKFYKLLIYSIKHTCWYQPVFHVFETYIIY